MDLTLLRCFVVTAEELHFGRAARRLDILPSALSRNIGLLEKELGIRLLRRTTREASLTRSGNLLLSEARSLLKHADEVTNLVRRDAEREERVFRIGAMDSAATGLMPRLLHDFHKLAPKLDINFVEEKTVKLLPKLVSGALDVAIVHPPETPFQSIEFEILLHERTLVALPTRHILAQKESLCIQDIAELPLILPTPRTRPHSYNLTMRPFLDAELKPNIVQRADEKHTIINMVAEGIGAALVPHWINRITNMDVVYIPLVDRGGQPVNGEPVAAAWLRGLEDPIREDLMKLLRENLNFYSE